nr:putative polygalacturonase [Triticum aestivum]
MRPEMSYSSDDENRPGECDWCHDDRGICDRFIELDEDRRFSIKLEETCDVHTLIPCFARCYVLERMSFEDHENFETKKIILSTEHGVDFQVKLYNAQSVTHFGCKNWDAFCKMYGLDEAYFHSSKNVRKMVDRTYYTQGSELTYQEKNHLVGFCTDLENYNIYNQTPQHYGQYVPLVHVLNYAAAAAALLGSVRARWTGAANGRLEDPMSGDVGESAIRFRAWLHA